MDARHAKQPDHKWSRLFLWFGVVLAVAGSIAVYTFVTHPHRHTEPKAQTVISAEATIGLPDRKTGHVPTPQKDKPSPSPTAPVKPKKSPAPSAPAHAAGYSIPSNTTPAASPKPKPSKKPQPTSHVSATPPSHASPKPIPKPPSPKPPPPKPKPTPTPTPSTSSSLPTPSVTWFTSSTAVSAAQRMAAANAVGDPVCSLSAVGQPDPAQIPADVKSVGVGESGNYWCLIFTR